MEFLLVLSVCRKMLIRNFMTDSETIIPKSKIEHCDVIWTPPASFTKEGNPRLAFTPIEKQWAFS